MRTRPVNMYETDKQQNTMATKPTSLRAYKLPPPSQRTLIQSWIGILVSLFLKRYSYTTLLTSYSCTYALVHLTRCLHSRRNRSYNLRLSWKERTSSAKRSNPIQGSLIDPAKLYNHINWRKASNFAQRPGKTHLRSSRQSGWISTTIMKFKTQDFLS